MIKTIFSLANSIAKRTRYSPTAIIEGRESIHLEKRVERNEAYELKRQAQLHAYRAKVANIDCPFAREKQAIIYDFADDRSNLNFEDAWLKIDEVEQRQSEQIWKEFNETIKK